MPAPTIRTALAAASLAALSLDLAGCAGSGMNPFGTSEPPAPAPSPAFAPPPPNMNVIDFVGRWGYASFQREGDRARTETAARGQCSNPYTIGRGPTGGVLMYLADSREQLELRLKSGTDGKIYLGPEGPAPDSRDREVINFDGRVLVLRWVDPEVASRYGTSVYVRCGAPGTAGTKRKTAGDKGQ